MTNKQKQRKIRALERIARQLENVNKLSTETGKYNYSTMINLWRMRLEAEMFSLTKKLLEAG